MKCEACGGDGLIEVGAYRGDDSAETRSCTLCGGRSTGNAVDALPELNAAAIKAGEAITSEHDKTRFLSDVMKFSQAVEQRQQGNPFYYIGPDLGRHTR